MKTKWSFSAGFLFPANAFAGCSNKWSVLFALWKDAASTAADDSVTVSIKCEKEGRVIELGHKNLYNLDDTASASDWVRSAAKLTQTARVGFTMSNAVTITDGACRVSDEIMGYAVMDANTVEKNNCYVTLINRKFRGHIAAYPITERSFDRIISLFSARRLITGTYAGWMNGKDEYRIPDTENDRYREWLNDCLVYALFNTASQMSSLRNISHNGVVHHLRNEFFFMSENEIWNLASGALSCVDENESVMEDIAHFSGERFVYKRLLTAELSAEARRVLDMARELVRRSFRNRMAFDAIRKDYHINAWDAGWYQD